jgi:hypothetical protein
MTPGTFPLLLYRGDTYRWQFTLWTDAGKTQPADLTGVVVKAEVRAAPGGALLAALACTVTLPNIITADLTATASATLPPTGAWDMQLTYPDGHVATVLAGAVTVAPDVTDSAAAATLSTLPLRAARMRS